MDTIVLCGVDYADNYKNLIFSITICFLNIFLEHFSRQVHHPEHTSQVHATHPCRLDMIPSI